MSIRRCIFAVFPIALAIYNYKSDAQTTDGQLDGISSGSLSLSLEKLQGSVIGYINSNGNSQSRSEQANVVLGNLGAGNAVGSRGLAIPFCVLSPEDRYFEVSLDIESNNGISVTRINGSRLSVNASIGLGGDRALKVRSQKEQCDDSNQALINLEIPEYFNANSYEISNGHINLIIKPE